MAVGSRAHMQQQAVAKRSRLRNFLMYGFHILVLFVAGGRVKDTQCGFKVSFCLVSSCYTAAVAGRGHDCCFSLDLESG